MKITETELKGCFVIEPEVYGDDRGYFFESYNEREFAEATGLDIRWKQDNQAGSQYGVIRGFHFQKPPYAQTKIVRVFSGKIWDVVVDIREDSPTYGQHISVELSGENKKQLLVPKGFAHAYAVLSESAVVAYKCDELYHPESEGGLYLFDESLNVDWGIPRDKVILSEKDKNQPLLAELKPMVL